MASDVETEKEKLMMVFRFGDGEGKVSDNDGDGECGQEKGGDGCCFQWIQKQKHQRI